MMNATTMGPAGPLTVTPLAAGDPQSFGDYRAVGRLGSGGMGEAFLAEHAGAWVVVKAVRAQAAPEVVARLSREVEALARIDSPRAARVVAVHLEDPRPWFAMEYVPGLTLAQRVAHYGPLPAGEVPGLAAGLLECIQAVHDAGVVHRDLKPENLVLTAAGPRLIDFGAAEVDEGTSLTVMGNIVGTVLWMAPEQVAGAEATPAVDVHAWGLLVLFAATGQPAFSADSAVSMMYRALHETPEVPDGLGRPLADLVSRALAKDPSARPAVGELAEALRTGRLDLVPPAPTPGPTPHLGAPAAAQRGASTGAVAAPTGERGAYPSPSAAGRAGRRRAMGAAAGIVATLALAGVAVAVVTSEGDSDAVAVPSASTSVTVSAPPSPPGASWEQAKAAFADYRAGKPGEWSAPVAGGTFQGGGPVAVAVQLAGNRLVMHTFDDGRWSAGEGATLPGETMTGMDARVADTTGGGGADIFVSVRTASGAEAGAVVFNFGRFATFRDPAGTSTFVYSLALDGGRPATVDGVRYEYRSSDASFELSDVPQGSSEGAYGEGPYGEGPYGEGPYGEASTSATETDPWDAATSDLAAYRSGMSGSWSDPIPGGNGFDAIVVQGTRDAIVVHGYSGGSWSEIDSSTASGGRFGDYDFQNVDTTGQGGEDILVTATIGSQGRYGTVVFNTGALSTFRDSEGRYGFWFDLGWDGSGLTDGTESVFTYRPGKATFEVS